jgi:tRNA synthetases class II (D, K and N)
VLAVLRQALAGMTSAIGAQAQQAVDLLGLTVPRVPEEIPVIHFSDALKLVGAPHDEPDLAPAHERALGQWAAETHGSDFAAIEGYPMRKRPSYTHPEPGDERWSNSFDLLFRGLEFVTGGQRLHGHSDYVAAIRVRGEDPAAYSGYLEAFAHGMPPHGGFAIGLERWASRLTQSANIREVTLSPGISTACRPDHRGRMDASFPNHALLPRGRHRLMPASERSKTSDPNRQCAVMHDDRMFCCGDRWRLRPEGGWPLGWPAVIIEGCGSCLRGRSRCCSATSRGQLRC